MKHTQGKWEISTRLTDAPDYEQNINRATISAGNYDICFIDLNCDEDKANARLIAKAPEMLELLREFKYLLSGYEHTEEEIAVINKYNSLIAEIDKE